jgi:small subunit ribosomal protein S2
MENKELLNQMIEAGVHFGYSRSKRHSSTLSFIFSTKNKRDLINLEDTTRMLEEAKEIMKSFAKGEEKILFVGTKPEIQSKMQAYADSISMPYVITRWIGGTITNWSEIKKRVNRLIDLRSKTESGELAKYTKKEQSLFGREITKLGRYFGGLVDLKAKPSLLVIIDPKKEHLAVEEAIKMNIPIIAISSTDCDIKKITNPILANDSALTSITFLMNELVSAYKGGR